MYCAYLVDVDHGARDSSYGGGAPQPTAVDMEGACSGVLGFGSDGKAVECAK